MGIALLAFATWVWRIASLRDGWKRSSEAQTTAIANAAGIDPRRLDRSVAPRIVTEIGQARDQYRRERDNARVLVDQQSQSILALNAEGERNRREAAARAVEVARLIGERDRWIAAAQRASTRTERLSADAEAAACEAAMDRLYQEGF